MTESFLEYNTTLGAVVQMPAKPEQPQTYTGVINQVFPLAANIRVLAKFCDDYLNLDQDDPLFLFKPAAPFVLMQVVDYGDLAQANTLGWFSQHELAFGIPVEWYLRDEQGYLRFVDVAMHYPFIYVDNPLSIAGGREVYGWAKSAVKFKEQSGTFDPAQRHSLVTAALDIKGTNLGSVWGVSSDATEVEFLSIYQTPRIGSGISGMSDLISAVPRALTAMITNAYSSFQMAALPNPYWSQDLQALQQLLSRWYGSFDPGLSPYGYGRRDILRGFRRTDHYDGPLRSSPLPQTRLITFKQLRDASFSGDNRNSACFQAIIGSAMTMDRIGDSGLLFDVTSGDSSGGIEISLLQSAEAPIVDTLGLITTSTQARGNNYLAFLRPLMPFWSKLDLSYGVADFQAWRTNISEWTTKDDAPKKDNGTGAPKDDPIRFVRPGSGTSEDIGGEFQFDEIVWQIFPIPAHRDRLQCLIDRYLCTDHKIKYHVRGRYQSPPAEHDAFVYLMVADFRGLKAATNQGTDYTDRELTFAVRVDFEVPNKKETYPALVPLYSFVESQWNASTTTDVYGRLTLKANFKPGKVKFPTYSEEGKDTGWNFVERVEALFLSENKRGQKASYIPFLDFYSLSVPGQGFEIVQPDDFDLTFDKNLGLSDIFSRLKPTSFWGLALKQVRNSKNLSNADYQAIVTLEHQVTLKGIPLTGPLDGLDQLSIGQPIPVPMKVKIYSYPSLDIYGILDLDCGHPVPEKNKDLQAHEIRFPCSEKGVPSARVIKCSMVTSVGENLCVRVPGREWAVKEDWPTARIRSSQQ